MFTIHGLCGTRSIIAPGDTPAFNPLKILRHNLSMSLIECPLNYAALAAWSGCDDRHQQGMVSVIWTRGCRFEEADGIGHLPITIARNASISKDQEKTGNHVSTEAEAGLELTQSFLIVAEELNFRRSAERLNIDQSALTRRIQKLEYLLGFSLFERTTREVSLTPAGRAFYEENARLIYDYNRSVKAARLVAEGKTGILRVAYMAFAATELMPSAVQRFRTAYPHVDVNLRYIRTQGQKLAIAHDEVDIGYMIGSFEHSDFHSLLLTSDPLYVVTPKNHALLHKLDIRPADLVGCDLILGDMIEWEAYRWQLNELFSAEGVLIISSLKHRIHWPYWGWWQQGWV
nr:MULTISPECIES: LysR family transcriptional regulator [Brucella/Ochrobactrum group]